MTWNWWLMPVLALGVSGCFGGETKIIGGSDDIDGPLPDALGDGGPTDGDLSDADAGPISDYAEDACEFEVDLTGLDGFTASGDRWAVVDGAVTTRSVESGGGEAGLLLRSPAEACSDVDATLTFVHQPGGYPVLAGRVNAAGRWYGAGYDGRFGLFVLLDANGTETTVVGADPIELEAGVTYRLGLRTVDGALLGTLYDDAADRPLVLLSGAAAPIEGPGRVGLFENSGAAVRFGRLEAKPVSRGGEGSPSIESLRLVSPRTLHLTTKPRTAPALMVGGTQGFSLAVNGAPVPILAVAPRDGATGELAITADAFFTGADQVTLTYDAEEGAVTAGSGSDGLSAFTNNAATNLLHDDTTVTPFEDTFEGMGLAADWAAVPREAFVVGGGRVTLSPAAAGRAVLIHRPLAERHVDASVTLDFQHDPGAGAGGDLGEVIAALRVRSVDDAQYQAAFAYREFEQGLILRRVGPDAQVTVLATASVDRSAVRPGTPLRLQFNTSGALLYATLSRVENGNETIIGSAAVNDTTITQPGVAGVGAFQSTTLRVDRVAVDAAAPPPPRISDARIEAANANRILVTVLAATNLRRAAPEGFTVWAGEERTVSTVALADDGLVLTLAGPPVQAGQRVYLTYDAGRGTITDSSRPDPRPLLGVDKLPVQNDAPPGPDLAIAHARLVTPDTVDLLVTDDGLLPVAVGAAEGLTLSLQGEPVTIVKARTLSGRNNIVRLSFNGEARPGDTLTLAYAAMRRGPVVDAMGHELRAFTGGYVENLLRPAATAVPFSDDFERDAGAEVGNAWEPGTRNLWALDGGRARYRSDDPEPGDTRLLRPAAETVRRYRLSARVRTGDFDDSFEPSALLVGSSVINDPVNPDDDFDLRLGFNFANQNLYLIADFRAVVAAAPNTGAAIRSDEWLELEMTVNGRAVTGRLLDDEGRERAVLRYFLGFDAPEGRFGVATSAQGTFYFDDVVVGTPEESVPLMLVTGARVSPAAANDLRLSVSTAQGPQAALSTSGEPGAWRVTVDGQARPITRVVGTPGGLTVTFGGAPTVARNRVQVSYDDRAGDVHDNGNPVPLPLESFGPLDAANQAEVGGDLFMTGGETVGPWGIDVSLNELGALPAAPEADAAESFTVTADGGQIPVRSVVVLREGRLRLLLGGNVLPGQRVGVTYTPGEAGARVLDATGEELLPPYDIGALNGVEPEAGFPELNDGFDRPGVDIGNGWEAIDAPDDWGLDSGNAVFDPAQSETQSRLLRPVAEVQSGVDITATFRAGAAVDQFVGAGLVARVAGSSGYRGWYVSGDGPPVLAITRFDEAGSTLLGVTNAPVLGAGEHTLRFRAHGPVLSLQLDTADGTSWRVLGVDSQPLGPGRSGLVAQGAAVVRFGEVEIAPARGYPARLAAVDAAVYAYDPTTVFVTTAGLAVPFYTDEAGFTVRVGGTPRAITNIALRGAQLVLSLDGAPLRAGDTITVDFDPTLGAVLDDSPIPQPLGPVSGLVASFQAPPLLDETEVVGRNVLALRFNLLEDRLPLVVEGDGGIEVRVAHASLGAQPVRYAVQHAWVDPDRDGILMLATRDEIPVGATLELRSNVRGDNLTTDSAGVPIADLALPAIAANARATFEEEPPDDYFYSWDSPDSGWSYYPRLGEWTERDGYLGATGSLVENNTTEAVAPPFTSARDMKASVDFTIENDRVGFNRAAFPRVLVRAYNSGTWVGCYIRNDLDLIPERDVDGNFTGPVNDFSPSLNCALEYEGEERFYFDECRMQFYEAVRGESIVRYDWEASWMQPHRLVVKVQGSKLRAELYNLEGAPTLVAAVEVPNIGDNHRLGMAGLGGYDSGRVRFSNFQVEPLEPGDFDPLDARFEPTGDCR